MIDMDMQTAVAVVVGGIGLTVISFIIKWAWTHTHKRIDDGIAFTGKAVDDLAKEVALKADNTELLRARDAQVTIFDQLRQHESEDRTRHETIVKELGAISGKMDTLLLRRRARDE